MSQPNRSTGFGCLGAFLLVLGTCSVCGGAIQGFGDRMPNPPPDIRAQFEETDHRINLMFTGGLALGFSGIVCVAVAANRYQKRS